MLISNKCMCENNYLPNSIYTNCNCIKKKKEKQQNITEKSFLCSFFKKILLYELIQKQRKVIEEFTCNCLRVGINNKNKIEIYNNKEPTIDFYKEYVEKINFLKKSDKIVEIQISTGKKVNFLETENFICYGKEFIQGKNTKPVVIFNFMTLEKNEMFISKLYIENNNVYEIKKVNICPLIFINHCSLINTFEFIKSDLLSHGIKIASIYKEGKPNPKTIMNFLKNKTEFYKEKSVLGSFSKVTYLYAIIISIILSIMYKENNE